MTPASRRPPVVRTLLRRGPALAAVAVLLVAGAGAFSLVVGGYRSPEVVLSPGTAWLAAPQGVVALLDGPSGEVVGTLRPGTPATDSPQVVQLGTSALVVDEQAGSVWRIDGATYAVAGPVILDGGGTLQALPSGSRTFIVDGTRGHTTIVDNDTLARTEDVPLDAFPGAGQAIVDAQGDLWVVDGRDGGLTRVTPSGTRSPAGQLGDGNSRLVTAQGNAVLLDVAAGRVGVLDDAGEVPSWACTGQQFGLDPQPLATTDDKRAVIAVPETGLLVVADLASGGCTSTALAPAGTAFGTPVQSGSSVLVPDRNTGEAVVVDLSDGVMVRVPAVDPGVELELMTKDGVVFYNDLRGPAAGVLRSQGGVWTASKWVPKYSTGTVTVPSLAAATGSLSPEEALQGLPAPPATAAPATSQRTTTAAPQTTVNPPVPGPGTSRAAPTTSATPTTGAPPPTAATTTAVPLTTTRVPPTTTTVSQAPTSVSQAPTSVSQAPTSVSQAPTSVSQAPTSVSQAPTSVSQAPRTSEPQVEPDPGDPGGP